MSERVYGNDYWLTMVYVDSYQDNVLKGWFHNPYLKTPQHFNSLADFIIKIESMLDLMGLPQSFSASRSFKKLNPVRSPEARGISQARRQGHILPQHTFQAEQQLAGHDKMA